MDQIFKISVVDEDDEGERLDKFITENMPIEHSRSFIQRLIKEESIYKGRST